MYNVIILFFLFITVNLYADKKWISIEPVSTTQNTKENVNKLDIKPSQMQPINKLIRNAKIIKRLVDNKRDKEKSNEDSKKNWYSLEN
ncbi:MAG: hypothetical protein KAR81_01025 [Sulfurimonas sp.]|nr:hypothetical protein [Sulfurimonas sp.]